MVVVVGVVFVVVFVVIFVVGVVFVVGATTVTQPETLSQLIVVLVTSDVSIGLGGAVVSATLEVASGHHSIVGSQGQLFPEHADAAGSEVSVLVIGSKK